jgi:RHS repeat-associated protein
MKATTKALIIAGISSLLASTVSYGDRVDRQRPVMPEVSTSPEAGKPLRTHNFLGQDRWKKNFQEPETVLVDFHGDFWGDTNLYVTLTEKTVTGAPDEIRHGVTDQGQVRLELYKTYTLSITGAAIMRAEVYLEGDVMYNLVPDRRSPGNPGRGYRIYYYENETASWRKVCGDHHPTWSSQYGTPDPVSARFSIQVRPDLGARPAVYGQTKGSGDDQADDGWTHDEPPLNANTVIGDGEDVSISGPSEPDAAAINFKGAFSLGRLWNGGSAGRLRLLCSRLDTNAYSPLRLEYAARSKDPNEVFVAHDLDDTNCISQVVVPHGLVNAEPLYGSALFGDTNLLDVLSLLNKLTNQAPDAVSAFLWQNFTTTARQTLTNSGSTFAQITATLVEQLNQIIQAGSIYDTSRFAGVTLSGRARRLLLLNPSGAELIRLHRFLLEDAYTGLIERLASTSYEINFFTPDFVGAIDSLGFFTLVSGASPFVTWRIDSPNGITNQWRLQEVRNGTTNGTTLTFAPASGVWTLTRGYGNEAYVESRTVRVTVTGGVTNRTEIQEIKDGQGTVCERNTEVYRGFDWGYEMVAVTNDPGGNNLTTLFTYCADSGSEAYRRVTSIVYPDGYWERRTYSTGLDSWHPYGSLLRVVHPWKDSPVGTEDNDCLVSDYAYPTFWAAGPGSFQLQTWHDAARWGENPDPTVSKSCSEVHGEASWIATDDCADSTIFTETRDHGSIFGEGDVIKTQTYTASSGRVAGQLRWKLTFGVVLNSYDYEFGDWDAVNHVFTVSEDQGLGTDLRQTIYTGHNGFGVSDPDLLGQGASGQAIEPVWMFPNRSTKEVRIIQNGNLVATEMNVYQGDLTNFALIDQIIYQRDCLGHATNVVRIDPTTHQQRVTYKADWRGPGTWPADLKFSETDERGTVVSYSYDSLKRVKSKTKLGVSIAGFPIQAATTNILAFDAAGRVLTNATAAGNLSLRTVTSFDLAGRVTTQISPEGLVTSIAYLNVAGTGQRITETYSSGTTKITQNFLDRRVASVTGSSVTNVFLDYGQTGWFWASSNFRLVPKNVTTNIVGSADSLRWTAVVTDPRYEPVDQMSPGFHTNRVLEQRTGFVLSPRPLPDNILVSPFNGVGDGTNWWETKFGYDFLAQRTIECRDGPDFQAESLGLASLSRANTYTNYYQLDSGVWFNVQEQWTYPYDNDATPVFVSRTRQRLTGFAANELSETQQFDADTNQTTTKVTVDLANKKVTTTTTVAQSSLSAVQLVLNDLLQNETTPTVSSPTWHYYDSLSREVGTRDPLGNLTGTRYDSTTRQQIATTNAQGLVITLEYYAAGGTNAGLLKCNTGPTGRKTYYNYDGCGRVIQTWGDVPYPEKREYNKFGDLTALTTYRGGNSWSGSSWPSEAGLTADVTHWYYDEATGLLTNKTDAAGRPVKFDYYDNHFPKSRIWARGASNTNIYSPNGDLVRIHYSDGSCVLFTNSDFPNLNRFGKPCVVIDSSGTNLLTYDHAQRLVASTCVGGLLAGITVSNHFNGVYGRDILQVLGPAFSITNFYAYDTYGRMAGASSGSYSATYGYVPNSDLLQTTTSKSNTTTVLTTSRTWDYGYRLRFIANVANGAVVTSHSYLYDWLDRRIQATLEDGSIWKYTYNDRNELIGAHRYWSDWTPVAGQQYGYDYDNIGNRKSAWAGGDANGANLHQTTYTANGLNQYTAISNPGYEEVLGVALATNAVIVNTATADRKVEYFHREITVPNGSGPCWTDTSVASGGAADFGGIITPSGNQTLFYDGDGNLIYDGLWTYEWDAENRLTGMSMTNATSVPNARRLRLDFAYDYRNRRVQKSVSTWNTSGFANPTTALFVYDLPLSDAGGWNLLAELDPSLSPLRTYTWGQDLSGTMEEAGGVGGLLMESFIGAASTNAFVSYDGNGNLTGLVDADTLSLLGRYEYSPVGVNMRASGSLGAQGHIRFSTKYWDSEGGVAYYGVRYAAPSQGRWISKDPIGEKGGNNLYGYCVNDPISERDYIGTDGKLGGIGSAAVDAYATGGASLLSEVSLAVTKWNDVQNFISATVDSCEGDQSDVTDLFVDLLCEANHMLARDFFLIAHQSGAKFQMHHIFPRTFRREFERAKIDIDKWQVRLRTSVHQQNINNYWNAEWECFLYDANHQPIVRTKLEMFRFAQMMLWKFGIGCYGE